MDLNIVSLIIAGLAFLLALAALIKTSRPAGDTGNPLTAENIRLRLQAYERLVLLTERIALPNLISRVNKPGISAYEMKMILTDNIRQEFEYNHTQQLYVSQASWDAVRNLKDQSILVVNKVASTLPPSASSGDLNKKILEILMSQSGEPVHELVLQALNQEAKKLMQ